MKFPGELSQTNPWTQPPLVHHLDGLALYCEASNLSEARDGAWSQVLYLSHLKKRDWAEIVTFAVSHADVRESHTITCEFKFYFQFLWFLQLESCFIKLSSDMRTKHKALHLFQRLIGDMKLPSCKWFQNVTKQLWGLSLTSRLIFPLMCKVLD